MWIRYNKREMVNLDRVTTVTIEMVRVEEGSWQYGVLVGMVRIALLPDEIRAVAILDAIQDAIGSCSLDISDLCRVPNSEVSNAPA